MSAFPARISEAEKRAGRRIGLLCVTEAKANAPISPSKRLYSKTLKRKKISARRQFFRGGLEQSIAFELLAVDNAVSVFVATNAPAAAYARYIHDEKGKRWFRRGAGTVAKGARADEKFIERAIKANEKVFGAIYADELKKEIDKL